MTQRVGHVHRAVAEVAQAAASELYDTVMGNNQCFAEWKRQHPAMDAHALRRAFVEANWGKCLGIARATMAMELRSPTIDPAIKEIIVEALSLDATLKRGRGEVMGAPPSRVLRAASEERK